MGISVGAASDLALRQAFIAHQAPGGNSQAASCRRRHRPPTPIVFAFAQTPTLATGSSARKQYFERVLETLLITGRGREEGGRGRGGGGGGGEGGS